jgi:hypothetical protein
VVYLRILFRYWLKNTVVKLVGSGTARDRTYSLHLPSFRIIKINNTVMPILLAGTIEFVHIEQVSALFTFRLGQGLLYYEKSSETHYSQRIFEPRTSGI